ncbi:hypothetical protein EJ06DRAFT_532376 [Trichodelitschia bisporula]|uniref:Uncharacterized protein n=1 Tax=Trichodelitschia bisporula TaxID=703511 RepID=A0A6G1HPN1_9PEZI|nr:hypothetical protein EJ06DRAFT_532376 [Trichodelitschia bisporula]
MAPATFHPFLRLPPELRDIIYSFVLAGVADIDVDDDPEMTEHIDSHYWAVALFAVSKQVHDESMRIFHTVNTFITFETPWDDAHSEFRLKDHVQIIETAFGSTRLPPVFQKVHLHAKIDSQRVGTDQYSRGRTIVLTFDDLERVCKLWMYTDINRNCALNGTLRLTLTVNNPVGPDPPPLALQKRLLEPFGYIKNLRALEVNGMQHEEATMSMKALMDVPLEPAEDRLAATTQLKDEGNAALKTDSRLAIKIYEKAFEKLHIICEGRRRHEWGDIWFDRTMKYGEFEGQNGLKIRTQLRTRLVANVMKAYLDMGEFEETIFWGKRSHNIINGHFGPHHGPIPSFPAAPQLGKIYYRLGVALKAIGETSEARHYLSIALSFLPEDQTIRQLLSTVQLTLG